MARPHIHAGVGTAPPGPAPDKVDPLQAFRLIDAKLARETHPPVPPGAVVPSRERIRDLLGLDHAEGPRWS
jgi:hypothetical protein